MINVFFCFLFLFKLKLSDIFLFCFFLEFFIFYILFLGEYYLGFEIELINSIIFFFLFFYNNENSIFCSCFLVIFMFLNNKLLFNGINLILIYYEDN